MSEYSIKGQTGTIRWAINSNAGFLLLLSQSSRNKIIRKSLQETGDLWMKAFLPQRFTNYVKRAPFSYRAKGKGFILHKARGAGLMKRWIDADWMGWDPWSADRIPLELIKREKASTHGSSYVTIQETLTPLIRADAKADLTAKAMAASVHFLPLVMTGSLRRSAMHYSRAEARAVSTKAFVKIRIPFPATSVVRNNNGVARGVYGYNQNVARIMKTLPTWEVQWIAKKLKDNILSATTAKPGTSSQFHGRVVYGPALHGPDPQYAPRIV